MKTFVSDGITYQVPDIKVISEDYVCEIEEGDLTGVQFKITNAQICDKDQSLLLYDLEMSEGADLDQLKPIVDNFIILCLYEQCERIKNEVSEERDSDT